MFHVERWPVVSPSAPNAGRAPLLVIGYGVDRLPRPIAYLVPGSAAAPAVDDGRLPTLAGAPSPLSLTRDHRLL